MGRNQNRLTRCISESMDPLQVNLKTLYFTNFDIKTTSICLIKIDYLLTRLLFKAKREKEDD
jgi:hypothetical protein